VGKAAFKKGPLEPGRGRGGKWGILWAEHGPRREIGGGGQRKTLNRIGEPDEAERGGQKGGIKHAESATWK